MGDTDSFRSVRALHGAPHCRWRGPVLVAALSTAVLSAAVDARITRIQVTSTESPTFAGRSFGTVGAYEKIIGKAFGAVDPADAKNAIIVDLALAPRNANGLVEYSMDFFILKPIDLTKGNHKLFYEVNNRGNKYFSLLNGFNVNLLVSGPNNNPTTAADAGDGFLMNQGYALAWSGWDTSAPASSNMTITVPVAKNADGSSIVGPSYEYISFDNATTTTATLTYPSATLDQSQATLTVRALLNDTPAMVPAIGWQYVDSQHIRLLPAGTPFTQSNIYEFIYPAKDPLVTGLGLAAVRDFASFLRYATADDTGTPNPLAGNVIASYSYGVSQSARYQHDYLWLGFNQDETNRQVFDAVLNWVGGAAGVFINDRFSQDGRTERNRQHLLYPESVFPFANQTLTDPITGKTDGRMRRCTASGTCPKVIEVNSANEYWVKAASLLHTDPMGTMDLPDPPNARYYLLSGLEHGGLTTICQQPDDPISPSPALRALFLSLDNWVMKGTPPPLSQVPRFSDGTLVSTATYGSRFPRIPGVTYTGLKTTRYRFDYGPQFDQGIISRWPQVTPPYQDNPANGPIYPSFVPLDDSDGNDIPGIRLPDVGVPLATYTGWSLRKAGFGLNDGCEGEGQKIVFAQTRAERLAVGDPRLSLEERYGTVGNYYFAVSVFAKQLIAQGFLLLDDAVAISNQALQQMLASGLLPLR
jgi:Alpha/beta hydrolase domain